MMEEGRRFSLRSQKLTAAIRHINPMPLLFKALLQGQKDRGFFNRHLFLISDFRRVLKLVRFLLSVSPASV
jgi:hypothetical protein